MSLRLHFHSGPLAAHYLDVPESVVMGRTPALGVTIPDPGVSSEHCRISFRDGRAWIEDLGSTNGTQLNGNAVTTAELHAGDEILLGQTRIAVEFVPEPVLQSVPLPSEAPKPPSAEAPLMAQRHTPTSRRERPPTQIPDERPCRAPAPRPASADRRSERLRRLILRLAAVVVGLIVLCASVASFRGCREEPSMLSAKARKAAYWEFAKGGVVLTVWEPAGVDRKAEPVTSGVPLPDGSVKDAGSLCLLDGKGKAVPCQFTPLSRWLDGSIKWVLLDFRADVAASNKVDYTLCAEGKSPLPDTPVKLEGSGVSCALSTGPLTVVVTTNAPGLIHSVKLGDNEIVSPTNPVQAVLVNQDGRVFKGSAPTKVAAECTGPMRSTIRVQGQFVDDSGTNIFGGKVGYDLRVTAYAGKPYVKLDFTLRNDGWYGYRNEHRPRQWLYLKSLRLDIPTAVSGDREEAVLGGKRFPLAGQETPSLTQWYKYPYQDAQGYFDIYYTNPPPHEVTAGMAGKHYGFYHAWTTNGTMGGAEGRVDGSGSLVADGRGVLTLATRRFWENHPAGFAAAADQTVGIARLSFLALPEGGCWPRTPEAFYAGTYQFEGGRQKTWTLQLRVGDGEATNACQRLDGRLFARAPAEWYRDTGAVLPMGLGRPETKDAELAEAWQRYDRQQIAKVRAESGDPAGPIEPYNEDRWGRVSIPGLWERCPDIFAGWMNYGDLVWSFGYCSLYYEWPYSMLQQYLRLGDPQLLAVGEEMARHREDIDQYHVEDTEPYLGGFQRYEKGEHGHLERQAQRYGGKTGNWERNANPSHTWNRGLLLHWALTGDPRSREAAEQNGRAYERFFRSIRNWDRTNCVEMSEFRVPAWGIENNLALYEYTGGTQWLARAEEIFDKTLLAMERNHGSRGHILKNGSQSAQFTGYMAEPVCRLHHYTGRRDVALFLKRVLDWQREKGTVRGFEKDGVYYPIMWREDWNYDPEPGETIGIGVGNAYDYPMCDGYAYLYRLFGDTKDLEFGRRLFKEIVLYLTFCDVRGRPRSPMGYHHLGGPFGSTPKVHAWSARYGQLYMQVEEQK